MSIDDIRNYLLDDGSMSTDFVEYVCQNMAQHSDVVEDFCAWLKSGNFDFEAKTEVEGWTAKKLYEKFPFLSAADIFIALSNLYDDPEGEKILIESEFAIR